MTLSTTVKSSDGVVWVYVTGTVAEVLQELADQGATAGNTVKVADDGTSAIYCRAK